MTAHDEGGLPPQSQRNRMSSYYTGQSLVPAGGEIHPG
jgi:hypothetical protein